MNRESVTVAVPHYVSDSVCCERDTTRAESNRLILCKFQYKVVVNPAVQPAGSTYKLKLKNKIISTYAELFQLKKVEVEV